MEKTKDDGPKDDGPKVDGPKDDGPKDDGPKDEDEFSYEEEQLQLILMKELEQLKLDRIREIKRKQDLEYQESQQKDLEYNQKKESKPKFEEVSVDEMRRIRLARFSN